MRRLIETMFKKISRKETLFIIFAGLCGWIVSGWWNSQIVALRWSRTTRYETFTFFISQYNLLIPIIMAIFLGWFFSLFFDKRRWQIGIFCGVIFIITSLIYPHFLGIR